MMILTHLLLPTITILARNDRTAAVVAFSCRQMKRNDRIQKELWILFVFKIIL